MTQHEQRWSAEERRRALELAAAHGGTRAAEMTGIPSGTIHSWRLLARFRGALDGCAKTLRARRG
jgi:transposase-like protein